jgi:hypothetical protein
MDTLTDEDKLLIDQLTSEYRIIQDKIDKIGSFRFTVRGWSVTLVIASIFATGSSTTLSPFLLLFLIVFLLLFYILERQQNRFGFVFGARALQIEKEIRRIIRTNCVSGKPRQDVGLTPAIAYHLSDASRRSAPSGRFVKLKRWTNNPDHLFYWGQTLVIVSTVAFLLFLRSRGPQTQATPSISVVVHEGTASANGDPAKELSDSQTQNALKTITPKKH